MSNKRIKLGGKQYSIPQQAIDQAIKASEVEDGINILAASVSDKQALKILAFGKTLKAKPAGSQVLYYLRSLMAASSLPMEEILPSDYRPGATFVRPPAPKK